MQVIAQQGDSIDYLCWRHLGTTDAVEATLLLNPGIAALGAVLPMGTAVILPDTVVETPRSTSFIQLWD